MQVLATSADQQDVYKAAVEPIVEDVLQGYNGTIMAYGQVIFVGRPKLLSFERLKVLKVSRISIVLDIVDSVQCDA